MATDHRLNVPFSVHIAFHSRVQCYGRGVHAIDSVDHLSVHVYTSLRLQKPNVYSWIDAEHAGPRCHRIWKTHPVGQHFSPAKGISVVLRIINLMALYLGNDFFRNWFILDDPMATQNISVLRKHLSGDFKHLVGFNRIKAALDVDFHNVILVRFTVTFFRIFRKSSEFVANFVHAFH